MFVFIVTSAIYSYSLSCHNSGLRACFGFGPAANASLHAHSRADPHSLSNVLLLPGCQQKRKTGHSPVTAVLLSHSLHPIISLWYYLKRVLANCTMKSPWPFVSMKYDSTLVTLQMTTVRLKYWYKEQQKSTNNNSDIRQSDFTLYCYFKVFFQSGYPLKWTPCLMGRAWWNQKIRLAYNTRSKTKINFSRPPTNWWNGQGTHPGTCALTMC